MQFRNYKDTAPFGGSHETGKLEEKKDGEQHLLRFCTLSNAIANGHAVPRRESKKSDACWSKLIRSERAQKTLAQIKAHAKALRSPSEKAERRGEREKRGGVSCLV